MAAIAPRLPKTALPDPGEMAPSGEIAEVYAPTVMLPSPTPKNFDSRKTRHHRPDTGQIEGPDKALGQRRLESPA